MSHAKHRERQSEVIDLGSAVTVMTLASALLLAVVVAFGAVTVTPADAQSAGANQALAPSATSEPAPTVFSEQPASSAEPVDGEASPAPSATGRTDEGAAAPVAPGTAGVTSIARPQPSTPVAPFAAQPAPFGTPTATPSPTSPSCPAAITGQTAGALSVTSPLGVGGTTSDDLQSFAEGYNAIRVANCLAPVPFANIRYDSCMEQRLFWMAEDPSTDPMSAWGHIGSQRSDGLPSVGCDGNLAGGSNNTGASVAQKWWDSTGHRTSLYKPTYTGSTANVCILFATTHGGVPNEPYSFMRAAARWTTC